MIFFTSDWHLNETRIGVFNPLFRPFSSIEEQNTAIISNVNRYVSPNDTLYHLGDVSVDTEGISLLGKVKCNHRVLIVGNYDEDKLSSLERYFDSIHTKIVIKLRGLEFHLNHYPIKMSPAFFNITGHIHSLWKVQRNAVNVGVDAWHFRPVSEDVLFFIKNGIENYYDENVFIC